MNCLEPTMAWEIGHTICKDGVRSPKYTFSKQRAFEYYVSRFGLFDIEVILLKHQVDLPCGKCLSCLIRKRKDMSVRLAHETRMHDDSCFLTLTYDDEHIPITESGKHTLAVADVQKFMKRLRRHLEYHKILPNGKLRYFAVGEYGSKTKRPHYHIMLFGWSPQDVKIHHYYKNRPLFISNLIGKLWSFGFHTVEGCNVGVAKYCAKYVTKKLTNKITDTDVVPEFFLASKRNGGIGASFFDKYGADFMRTGLCTIPSKKYGSVKVAIPQYYYRRCRQKKLPIFLQVRDERLAWIKANQKPSNFEDIKRKADTWLWNDVVQSFNNSFF